MFPRPLSPQATRPASATLVIRLVQSVDEFAALAPHWDALLSDSSTNSIFQTWHYLSLWWRHFGHDSELAIATAEHAGELVGVAPLQIRRGHSGARKHLRHLCFLGTMAEGEALLCDFPVRRGWENDVIAAFFAEGSPLFDLHWDLLYLPFVPADSPCTRALVQSPGLLHHRIREIPEEGAPLISFPSSWEEFLGGLSAKFRSNLRNAIRTMETKIGAEEIQAGAPMSVAEMHRQMTAFHAARWDAANAEPPSPQFLDFERELLESYHQCGALQFLGWKKGDEVISLNCGLVYDNLLWGYQMGWNPAFAKVSPGQVAMASIIRRGIECGYRGVNMLLGGGAYKGTWADAELPLCRLEAVHLRSLKGNLFGVAKLAQENWQAMRHHPPSDGSGERAA